MTRRNARDIADDLVKIVYESFSRSHDFNGIPLLILARWAKLGLHSLKKKLKPLLEDRKVTLAFESISINPHIKRLEDLPIDMQVSQLDSDEPSGICVYPSSTVASARVGSSFDDRPYTKRLATAEPQLRPAFFELSVLERYFRDPRYLCRFGDSEGFISIGNRAYASEETSERDKVTIQSFGIGYNPQHRRVVGVFLRYLSDLSREHQLHWKTYEINGRCVMNSDYFRASIWGKWPRNYSGYAAFIQEQVEINKICELMRKPHLFKETYEEDKRPIMFSSMLRPTKSCFNEFVHLLDKMISDNIEKGFLRATLILRSALREATVQLKFANWLRSPCSSDG